jgi:hypothetical protein
VEDSIDKMKVSDGTDEDGDNNGIKKFVPKGLGSWRRRKNQEKEDEQRASEEAARERGTLENDSSSFVHGSGDGSSLITYDSDIES